MLSLIIGRMMQSYQYRLRIYYHLGIVLLFIFLLSCDRGTVKVNYFPEVGKRAIQQRALALKSNLNVLSIALEPGLEDLAALAYFRLHRGAEIISAYVSNGEAGRNDLRWEYPNYLAATRRSEAERAISRLDGDIHYLNNPHIVAARDSGIVREKWPKADLISQITGLIDNYQPDIILIGNDWVNNDNSLRWRILSQDIVETVKARHGKAAETNTGTDWKVSRVLGYGLDGGGVRLPTASRYSGFGNSYAEIAEDAAREYESLKIQRKQWQETNEPVYSVLFSETEVQDGQLESNMPTRYTQRLRGIAQRIEGIAEGVVEKDPESFLTEIVAVLDTLSITVGRRFEFSNVDQRALFHWKKTLEALKCSILGVEARYTVSEEILTMSQLDYITVEEVKGIDKECEASVCFGGIDKTWAVNEGYKKKFRYMRGDRYRLLSPPKLDLTMPLAKNGLESAKLAKTLTLFVIYEAPTKEKNFIYRSPFKLRFAPKFSAEVLTPIVRIIRGEKLIVRLTNYSRDGVRDTIIVKHEKVDSMPGLFRLNEKNGTYTDTLSLIWKDDPPDGNYLFPIEIAGFEVANFAARKFAVEIDAEKRVGYISAHRHDALAPTLRRLGIKYLKINPDRNITEKLADLDVLIVDGHSLTPAGKLKNRKRELNEFVKNGGHLIYLAQDATEWNNSGLWEEIALLHSYRFDENYPLNFDEEHPFLSSPNTVKAKDWDDWLYRRAFNTVKLQAGAAIEAPVRTREDDPLILTKGSGNGRLTYIDLALRIQLMNIHPGAFRLLANLISN